MKYTHVIWDFNGTILDDVNVGFITVNILLKKRGLANIPSIEEYKKLFGFPIIDYYIKLGFDFEKESYDDVAVEWADEYLIQSKNAVLQEGIIRLLSALSEKGIKQVILTASETEMVTGQLRDLSVYEYFNEILGLDNILAYSKTEIGKNWVKKEKPARAVLIGDTIHDHETAAAMGVDCILIAGGHQDKERLVKTGRYVADDIEQVYDYLLNS